MKKTTIIKGLVAIVAIVIQTQILFAQWQFGNAGTFTYGRTNNNANVGGIGIGSFPNGTPPLAALHINTNAPFPTNTFWNPGEVFRTDCPAAITPFWRMLRGATEQFNINSPVNSFDVNLVAVQNGNMNFFTNNIQHMTILSNGYVGIGNSNPGHLLDVFGGDIDVNSNNKGFMINNNYVLRNNGMITCIYVGANAGNTSSTGLRNTFVGPISGNSNTIGVDNTFVGFAAGRFNNSGRWNTFVGSFSGLSNTFGYRNTFIGFRAGRDNLNGRDNTFIGTNSGIFNTTGIRNTFVGNASGSSNTIGLGNTFVGNDAGTLNLSGNFNTFIGEESGQNNTIGNENTFVGHHAGRRNTIGSSNSFFGYHAGGQNIASTGNRNTFLGCLSGPSNVFGNDNIIAGYNAGQLNTNGNMNVILGNQCGFTNSSGSGNVFIGFQTAYNNKTGNNNVVIGNSAGLNFELGNNNVFIGNVSEQFSALLNNVIAIGANSIVTSNNQMILGNNLVNIGIGLSNDNIQFGPQNKLEINADQNSFSYTGIGGSGLRFRQLTENSTPSLPNVTNTVLSVNNDGDVILVPNNIGSNNFGNICGQMPQPLTNHWEIPTDIYNYNFTGKGTVNILNTTLCSNTFAKFTVYDDVQPKTLAAINNTGIFDNIAGFFKGSDSYKVHALVVPGGGGNVGFGVNLPNFAYRLDVYGNVYINGNIDYTGALNHVSDQIFKTNVDTINNALQIIELLKPKSFYFDTTNIYGINFSSLKQYGLIAQDVETVLPELVTVVNKQATFDSVGTMLTPPVNYKSLNYNAFIAIALKGIKELKSENDSMRNVITSYESRISSIENMLAQCCEQTKSAKTDVNATVKITTDPTLNNQTQLYQNRPNPFNVKTTFAYKLGEGGYVELIIEDSYGRLITTLVSQKQTMGDYSIEWNAENITSGIYFYSLKVNGIVLVKKAIKY